MITFAAIAASGDVNVNAIAPGIAARSLRPLPASASRSRRCLPYNYLISKIKDLTSDMQVFVDELVTKIAEAYAPSDRPDPVAQPRLAAE